MQLGHLLTRSGLTRLEVSFIFSPGFFYLWSVVFGILINLLRGILFVFCKQFLPSFCILSKTGFVFSSLPICVFGLLSVQVCPAVFLVYFISAAVILSASLALMLQFSLLYNEAGRTIVLYCFILVFFKGFCCVNILLTMPGIFK